MNDITRARMSWYKNWIGVQCPHGYAVTTIQLDKNFGGSMAAVEITKHQRGENSLYDRLAAKTCEFHNDHT